MWGIYIGAPVLLLLVVWLFLIAPGKSTKTEKLRSVKFAHRGLHGKVGADSFAAENSLTAFERAVAHGYGIELDVQVTKDGEAVIFHDDTLDRVCGVQGKVKDKTLEELRELSLLGTSDKIPTFAEVLELVGGRVPLLVEMKETGFDHTISEKTAEVLRGYDGDYIVESFSPLAFDVFRKNTPDVPRGFLSDKLTKNEKCRSVKFRVTQRFLLNFKARPAFIVLNHKLPGLFPAKFVSKLFGTPMLAWTICSEDEEREAYKNGFSGIIFENYLPEK